MTTNTLSNGTDSGRLDLRGRIVLGFSLIVGSVLMVFGLVEMLYGSDLTAAINIAAGCLLTFNALMLLNFQTVDESTHVFLAVVFVLAYSITLLSGGRSGEVLMATPIFAFIVTLVEQKRWAIGWYTLLMLLIVVAYGLYLSTGNYPIQFEAEWTRNSVYRTPLIASLLAILVALHYRRAIEEFRDTALANSSRLREAVKLARASHDRLDDFADQAADWYWETDADGCMSYVSPAFSDVTGIAMDKVLGSTLWEIYQDHGGSEIDHGFLSSVEMHQPFRDLRITWDRPGNEAPLVVAYSGRPIYNDAGRYDGYRGVATDITESHLLLRQLEHRARIDQMTGLLNRGALLSELHDGLHQAAAGEQPFSLALIDLDDFKPINDQAGHAAGDEMLGLVGECLRQVPEGCFVGRLGGDEFLLVMPQFQAEKAKTITEDLRLAIGEIKMDWEGTEFRVTASIGLIIEDPIEMINEKRWLGRADQAVYASKHGGRNRMTVVGGAT